MSKINSNKFQIPGFEKKNEALTLHIQGTAIWVFKPTLYNTR